MANEAVKLMIEGPYVDFWNRHKEKQLFFSILGMVRVPLQRGAKVSAAIYLTRSTLMRLK